MQNSNESKFSAKEAERDLGCPSRTPMCTISKIILDSPALLKITSEMFSA